MAPSNGIGEVSEVRFQVLNVGVLMQLAVCSSESLLNCVCDLQTILGAHCVSRQSFVGVENHRKHLYIQGFRCVWCSFSLGEVSEVTRGYGFGLNLASNTH